MDKFSINDWLTIQTRKDLTYIRRSMEHESVNYAIFADLFIAFVAFSLEHIFWTVNEETGVVEKMVPSAYWIFTSVLLFLIPAIIFYYNYCLREKNKYDVSMSAPVDDLIDLFDNEICYNVMTADSMRDHFKGPENPREEIEKEVKLFYFIEAAYYANKAISQLSYFYTPNTIAIQNNSNNKGVSFVRFKNVCAIVKDVYDDLVGAITTNEEYKKYLEDGIHYIQDFNTMCVEISKNDDPNFKQMAQFSISINGMN